MVNGVPPSPPYGVNPGGEGLSRDSVGASGPTCHQPTASDQLRYDTHLITQGVSLPYDLD